MSWLMPCLLSVRLKTYRHPIDMNAYKKDFENAVEMIDWQNKMLKQQADEIEELKKRNLFLESIYRTIKVQER
jgi:hypothetical protein